MKALQEPLTRRRALGCLAFGGAGTLFTLSSGVLAPFDLSRADEPLIGLPLFVQLSDTHIGFHGEVNTDVGATLQLAIERINSLPQAPALVLHTGDITDNARPEEFDAAAAHLRSLRVTELHTVPGEHDLADARASEYFNRYGRASRGRGYYSFDHQGVHFVALVNVRNFRQGSLGSLGEEQLKWLAEDLDDRPASTPIVVFAHMPLWDVYRPWGWGTSDAEAALLHLRRFGSVTILNGHVHQVIQKTEGNLTLHATRSTAYPQPLPGDPAGPGPQQVAPGRLLKSLGLTSLRISGQPPMVALNDSTIG